MSLLRWILALPTAVLARIAVQLVVGTALRAAMSLSGVGIRESPAAFWLHLFIEYFLAEAVFVVVGAKVAPRRRSATAVTLAILGFCLSLTTHVVAQALAGNRVGSTNYLHLGLETAGLFAGAAFILVREQKREQRNRDEAAAVR